MPRRNPFLDMAANDDWGSEEEKCKICGKAVWGTDRLSVEAVIMHKACFKCKECNSILKLGTYAAMDGEYFCKPHFKQGNYSEGFGKERHSKKWVGEHAERGGIAASAPASTPSHADSAALEEAEKKRSAEKAAAEKAEKELRERVASENASAKKAIAERAAADKAAAEKAAAEKADVEKAAADKAEAEKPPSDAKLAEVPPLGLSVERKAAKRENLRRALQSQFTEYGAAELDDILDKFDQADLDGNGLIDKDEFQVLMNLLKGREHASMVERMQMDLHFKEIDTDASGGLDPAEFIAAYSDIYGEDKRSLASKTLAQVSTPRGEQSSQASWRRFRVESFKESRGGCTTLKTLAAPEEVAAAATEAGGEADEGLTMEESAENIAAFEQSVDDIAEAIIAIDNEENDGFLGKDEVFAMTDLMAPLMAKLFIAKLKRQSGVDEGSAADGGAGLIKAASSLHGSAPAAEKASSGQHRTLSSSAPPTFGRDEVRAAMNSLFNSPAVKIVPIDVKAAFDKFEAAETVPDIVNAFKVLRVSAGVEADASPVELAQAMQEKSFNRNYKTKIFWTLLDSKRNEDVYNLSCPVPAVPRVLVVGAGPSGLRLAIEALCMGCRVTIVEKRAAFTRHNLLHIWDSSIRDLKATGAKFWHSQFCTGGINHVSIRRLQMLLLKTALLLGAEVAQGEYAGCSDAPDGAGLWHAEVTPTAEEDQALSASALAFNVLVGAEGARSKVGRDFGFERKVMKGADAIGLTANFVNGQTSPERGINEFGILRVYNQDFFNSFETKYGIVLENLVYYRGETHYFVTTAKRPCLLKKGVFRADVSGKESCGRDNIDPTMMEQFMREISVGTGLPDSLSFADNGHGGPDTAIFDFSTKEVVQQPARLVSKGGHRLLVALVGDALVEPFWPEGTGANRGILSALDTAWMIKEFAERPAAEEASMYAGWMSHYKIMMSASPADLKKPYSGHTIAPDTRYKTTTHGHFH